MKRYVERDGYLERVWRVRYRYRGFEFIIYVRGTEPEMQAYMESEMGYVGSYYAMNEQEEEMVNRLKHKIYIAPKDYR